MHFTATYIWLMLKYPKHVDTTVIQLLMICYDQQQSGTDTERVLWHQAAEFSFVDREVCLTQDISPCFSCLSSIATYYFALVWNIWYHPEDN